MSFLWNNFGLMITDIRIYAAITGEQIHSNDCPKSNLAGFISDSGKKWEINLSNIVQPWIGEFTKNDLFFIRSSLLNTYCRGKLFNKQGPLCEL